MDANDTKTFEYFDNTAITDDVRMVKSETENRTPVVKDGSYCPICLDDLDEPRTLPCNHLFCRVCLQYTIDYGKKDFDSDRGFECILCGRFVKVLNYSIPRTEWADNIPDTKYLQDKTPYPSQSTTKEKDRDKQDTDTEKEESYRWTLEWKISTYPKSYFLMYGVDPSRRTEHGFILTPNQEWSGEDEIQNNGDNDAASEGDYDAIDTEIERVDVHVKSASDKSNRTKSSRKSFITSAVYYNENVVVYDEGMCEVLVYNSDMTLESSVRRTNIFAIAILGSDLFMTNPHERCIEILDLSTLRRHEAINLTMKCYGISSFDDQLAVLLCDSLEEDVHISFLNKNGIIGGSIALKSSSGILNFENPRHLTVCPLTRLLYVSDNKIGAVKCYRLDGHLSWEKRVFDAGFLTAYNGYVIISRKFTSSLDVLSGGGEFAGRLESATYGIEAPGVITVRNGEPEIMVVDKHDMIHVFIIRKMADKCVKEQKGCSAISCILL